MDSGHLAVMFFAAAARHGGRVATRIRRGDGWTTQTYAELGERARRLAGRLAELGVQPGDRVAIFSANRPEWTLADLACLSARAISVPLYPTSTPEQARHILRDSGTTIAFVAGAVEAERIAAVWSDLPDLRRLISFDEPVAGDERVAGLAAEMALAPSDPGEVDRRLGEASADDLASLIYTSGTTGDPKGVMLTNRGFTYQVEVLNQFFDITPDDHSLCFLPLSHALERAWTFTVLANGCMNT